ncbi:MAG: LacI family transcriptional regulator [Fimbriimonadales bacterium]|nr:LacI family transcriptional regulator [Fimbriimonadales bacterium]
MRRTEAKRPTIEDVARRAGVGKATVSSVLNGRTRAARISAETARRVVEAASELGYRPNQLARMLVRRKADILAVVFQRGYFFLSWSSFTAEVMRGVSSAAVELGYDLMLHTREVEDRSEADVLTDGRIDGALLLRDAGDPLIPELLERGFPFVRFFSKGDRPDEPFVDADNFGGGRIATAHLLDLGHRRVAFIRGSDRSTASNDRLAGYLCELEQRGLEPDPSLVCPILSPNDAPERLNDLMRRPDPPTALFVWSDDVALACIPALMDMGLRVPADVSIVGFDSLEVCNRSVPPLTSVRQPVFDMAREATRLLSLLIDGGDPAERRILFPLQLDVRGSTAPCPKRTIQTLR